MRSLWIARHGNRQDFVDPDWHATADRPHDPGLSPDGVEQARALGRRIASLSVDGIVASPFLRAVQTAQQVADLATHTVRLDPGLGEWHNADWFETSPDPLPADTLAERFERVVPDHEPCLHPSFPEPKADAFDRIGRTAQCLTERHPDASLLLVGHGITVQGVLHGLLGDVPDPGCPLASLTHLVHEGTHWRLAMRNDVSHLERGPQAADRRA